MKPILAFTMYVMVTNAYQAPGISGIQTNFALPFSNIHTEMAMNANRDRVWLDHAK